MFSPILRSRRATTEPRGLARVSGSRAANGRARLASIWRIENRWTSRAQKRGHGVHSSWKMSGVMGSRGWSRWSQGSREWERRTVPRRVSTRKKVREGSQMTLRWRCACCPVSRAREMNNDQRPLFLRQRGVIDYDSHSSRSIRESGTDERSFVFRSFVPSARACRRFLRFLLRIRRFDYLEMDSGSLTTSFICGYIRKRSLMNFIDD